MADSLRAARRVRGRYVGISALVAAAWVGWAVAAYAPTCGTGVIASGGDVLSGEFGMVSVDVCVEHVFDTDLYTYRLTNLGPAPAPMCAVVVSGLGTFTEVEATTPTGWSLETVEGGAGSTWWRWAEDPQSEDRGLEPGEILILSISLGAETTPTDVPASIWICDRGPESFRILGPSACPSQETDRAVASCACGDEACTGRSLFHGEGTQLVLLRGPEEQTLLTCEPSWVRHGFSGVNLSPEDVAFALSVDGVPIPVDRVVHDVPTSVIGVENTVILWHAQFPEDWFSEGTYEIVGQWDVFDPAGFSYTRALTLIVAPCTTLVPLPDLTVEVLRAGCECGWTLQDRYECELDVRAEVHNAGAVDSQESRVTLSCPFDDRRRLIPALAPGESQHVTLQATFEVSPYSGEEPCPIEFQLSVDSAEQIPESNEGNNIAEGESCCQADEY